MAETRVSAKISRKDSLRVIIQDNLGQEIEDLVDCSYENLQALQNHARQKLPMGYVNKMFQVSVICESKGYNKMYRLPVARPIKRKR